MRVPLAASAILAQALVACDGSSPVGPDETLVVEGDLSVHRGALFLVNDTTPFIGPELHWIGHRGAWLAGIDVANNGGSRDFVLAAKLDWPLVGQMNDLVYAAHNAERAPTLGIGVTPPRHGHRLEVGAQETEPEMGTLLLRRGREQTGNLMTVIDSSGRARWWMDAAYWLSGRSDATGAAVSIKAEPTSNRALALARPDGSAVYGFEFTDAGSGTLLLRYLTGGVTNLALHTNGHVELPAGLTTSALRVDGAAAPEDPSSPCRRGEITFDEDFVYVCVADDTWKRSSLASW